MADEETGYDQLNNVSTPSSTANDKIYEPKNKRKIIRLLTVLAYVFFVSLAAIMLSLYYVIMWEPVTKLPADSTRGRVVLERRIQTEPRYPMDLNIDYRQEEIMTEQPNTTSSYKNPLDQQEKVLSNQTYIQENAYTPTKGIMLGEPDTTSSHMVVQEDTTMSNQDRVKEDTPKEVYVQGETVTPVDDHLKGEPLNEQLEGETNGKFTDRVYQLVTTLNPDDI